MKKSFANLSISCAFMLATFLCTSAFAASSQPDNAGAYLPREIADSSKIQYSGNVKTQKYHNQNCKFYDCRDCTKFFGNPQAAQKAGFVACGKCVG